jgi:hypothetical protein
MSRELAIRVPSEIGGYVRSQHGSASEVVLSLAEALYKSKQAIRVADPGAGEDRVKIRVTPRVIQFVRAATHSRDTAVAFRKLLLWGARGRPLPEHRRAALPLKHEPATGLAQQEPRAIAAPVAPRCTDNGEDWNGVKIPAGAVPGYPSPGMQIARYNVPPVYLGLQSAESARLALREPETVLSRVLQAIPVPVLAVGIPIAFMAGGYLVLKALGGLFGGGVATGAKTAIGAARVAPTIAVWVPKAASGLGALL